jgi:hypothetical protein
MTQIMTIDRIAAAGVSSALSELHQKCAELAITHTASFRDLEKLENDIGEGRGDRGELERMAKSCDAMLKSWHDADAAVIAFRSATLADIVLKLRLYAREKGFTDSAIEAHLGPSCCGLRNAVPPGERTEPDDDLFLAALADLERLAFPGTGAPAS